MGLLDPATSDGRVIFFLPWQKQTIAGTTDLPCQVTHNPKPTEDEIMFILQEVKNYLNPDVEVRRGDVLSAWSGIRPLVSDPNKPNTQSLARNHIVHVSDTNLVTIAGGKWTTYRAMAMEAVDAAVQGAFLTLTCSVIVRHDFLQRLIFQRVISSPLEAARRTVCCWKVPTGTRRRCTSGWFRTLVWNARWRSTWPLVTATELLQWLKWLL